jgi:hypothetical protein
VGAGEGEGVRLDLAIGGYGAASGGSFILEVAARVPAGDIHAARTSSLDSDSARHHAPSGVSDGWANAPSDEGPPGVDAAGGAGLARGLGSRQSLLSSEEDEEGSSVVRPAAEAPPLFGALQAAEGLDIGAEGHGGAGSGSGEGGHRARPETLAGHAVPSSRSGSWAGGGSPDATGLRPDRLRLHSPLATQGARPESPTRVGAACSTSANRSPERSWGWRGAEEDEGRSGKREEEEEEGGGGGTGRGGHRKGGGTDVTWQAWSGGARSVSSVERRKAEQARAPAPAPTPARSSTALRRGVTGRDVAGRSSGSARA